MFIFDIDDTLTIIGERKEHLRKEVKDWDAFYSECGKDEPNWPIVNLCRHLMMVAPVAYVTSRREDTRGVTIEWLKMYGLWNFQSSLHMRPVDCKWEDAKLKIHLAQPFRDATFLVFDDRTRVVRAWRDAGYTCLQVQENNY